jgi:hypothetical protein
MITATILTEQAERLADILHEYSDKVRAVNEDLLAVMQSGEYGRSKHASRIATLLDRVDVLWKPLLRITSQASQLLERERLANGDGDSEKLDPITTAELSLRVFETESQIHHMLRLADELRKRVAEYQIAAEVKALRYTAGLNAMKGGPLRPDE